MKHRSVPVLIGLLASAACGPSGPETHYGFVTLLGNDTISVEQVTRRGDNVHVEAVDRFPRLRRRHADITLDSIGGVRTLTMDIHTPSESAKLRDRRVTADVARDSVRITKKDDSSTVRRVFGRQGSTVIVAHVPQMYSLYERYFQAAHNQKHAAGDTVQIRQFYVDREFDRFPLHTGVVRFLTADKAEVRHDWLSGAGDATLDSTGNLLSYSGARSTYQVSVTRVSQTANIDSIAAGWEKVEAAGGQVKQLSPRDTARATIGSAQLSVDYSRPLARGRVLLGNVIPFGNVWRTGANAATQLMTSAPITLAGIKLEPGTYTLWTLPKQDGVDLIVNGESGQWGTEYNGGRNVGVARMKSDSLVTQVEQFTISIIPGDAKHGTIRFEWGPFRWTAPIDIR